MPRTPSCIRFVNLPRNEYYPSRPLHELLCLEAINFEKQLCHQIGAEGIPVPRVYGHNLAEVTEVPGKGRGVPQTLQKFRAVSYTHLTLPTKA